MRIVSRPDPVLMSVEEFAIQLTFEHPDISPDVVTEKIGIEPIHRRLATPGVGSGQSRGENHFWRIEHVFEGKRFFFEEVEELLAVLTEHRAFMAEFNKKGIVTITIQLSGQVNIGDEAKPDLLYQMAVLGVRLGVEVFPVFQNP